MIEMTPWFTQPPVRPGWYVASAERNDAMRAYFDGASWSASVDEAASDADHVASRATPMPSGRAIEWRGLTQRSAQWLAAELNRA